MIDEQQLKDSTEQVDKNCKLFQDDDRSILNVDSDGSMNAKDNFEQQQSFKDEASNDQSFSELDSFASYHKSNVVASDSVPPPSSNTVNDFDDTEDLSDDNIVRSSYSELTNDQCELESDHVVASLQATTTNHVISKQSENEVPIYNDKVPSGERSTVSTGSCNHEENKTAATIDPSTHQANRTSNDSQIHPPQPGHEQGGSVTLHVEKITVSHLDGNYGDSGEKFSAVTDQNELHANLTKDYSDSLDDFSESQQDGELPKLLIEESNITRQDDTSGYHEISKHIITNTSVDMNTDQRRNTAPDANTELTPSRPVRKVANTAHIHHANPISPATHDDTLHIACENRWSEFEAAMQEFRIVHEEAVKNPGWEAIERLYVS